MTRVEIWNYKTIEHVAFDFEGYTLILGRNFIGKSALIGAIVSALTNRVGDSFIRYGEKFCQVLIQRDGHSVLWHKEKGDSYYVIDGGAPLKKIGRADLPSTISELGFAPLDVAGEKVLLWYARQFEPLFLVNKTKTNFTTELIASISNLDRLYAAIDAAKKDAKSKKSEATIRKTDLRDAQEQLNKYGAFEEYLKSKGTSQKILAILEESEIETAKLSKFVQKIETCKQELSRTFPATKMQEIKTLDNDRLLSEIKLTTTLLGAHTQALKELKLLTPTKSLPAVEDSKLSGLHKLSTTVASVKSMLDRANSAVATHNKLKLSENAPDSGALCSTLDRLGAKCHEVAGLSSKYSVAVQLLNDCGAANKLTSLPDLSSISNKANALRNLTTRYSEATSELTDADKAVKEEERIAKSIAEELSEFKECPTCLRSFNEH